jgi:hypothetical protein
MPRSRSATSGDEAVNRTPVFIPSMSSCNFRRGIDKGGKACRNAHQACLKAVDGSYRSGPCPVWILSEEAAMVYGASPLGPVDEASLPNRRVC